MSNGVYNYIRGSLKLQFEGHQAVRDIGNFHYLIFFHLNFLNLSVN